MSHWKILTLSAFSAVLLTATSAAPAQVVIGIGPAPGCPYGYFDYSPYDCAPYGYYGPDWFTGGLFIGAGPWFHGPRGFYGHVDNRFDPHHGYSGPMPGRGDRPFNHFQGNEARDGQGHVGNAGHEPGGEHRAGAQGGSRGGGGGNRGR
ncbi:MAG: hypothetical protein JWM43_333 [Acidobacteriaceae bacterium]|nr:hypothetical protein [Acidobacteriaceae bacterium]